MCSQTTKETVTFDPKLCGYTSILWWSREISWQFVEIALLGPQ